MLIRIEQLYPFPVKQVERSLKDTKMPEFFWCQEEPKNMGAWNTARHYIDRTLDIIQVKKKKVNICWKKCCSITCYRKFKQTSCRTKRNIRKGNKQLNVRKNNSSSFRRVSYRGYSIKMAKKQ